MNRRLRLNYFKAAAPTARYCAVIFVIAVLIFSGMLFYASHLLDEVSAAVGASPDHPVSLFVQGHLISMAMLVVGGFLLFLMTNLIVLMVIGERIGGPSIAIRAAIAQIKEGDYNIGRQLRPNDELHDIMNDLKDLAKTLGARERGNAK